MKKLLYIDLFCGAGGTSTGVESATINGQKCAHVIACVNHDPHAIASHLANHPEAKHYTEDIRTLDLTTLVEHTTLKRAEYPESLLVLWASLECTNFSRAKGGHPRDADSRTLAEHLFRYIDALKPDYIQIENVREFMMWGDLDENGKPVSKDAGRLYLRWVRNVCKRGYGFQHRILNAANYGAYTTRERFFGIFARKGLPIVFPEPTYSKDAGQTLFDEMKPWRPVREVLDLEDCGRSIFRDKPLSEKTLQRIYAGLVKFVAGGKDAFHIHTVVICGKWIQYAQIDLELLVVIAPVTCGGSRGDSDTTLLLLCHPVHGGCTIVHLTNLVSLTRIEQDTLRSGGLTGVDVSHDADIARQMQILFCHRFLTFLPFIPFYLLKLEAEVCECTVSLCHTVHILLAFEGTTLIVECVHNLGSQLVGHRLTATLTGELNHVLH